jgi:hypothetical protein
MSLCAKYFTERPAQRLAPRERGGFTPVEQSAGLLARIVSGEFDHRSGELGTPEDR